MKSALKASPRCRLRRHRPCHPWYHHPCPRRHSSSASWRRRSPPSSSSPSPSERRSPQNIPRAPSEHPIVVTTSSRSYAIIIIIIWAIAAITHRRLCRHHPSSSPSWSLKRQALPAAAAVKSLTCRPLRRFVLVLGRRHDRHRGDDGPDAASPTKASQHFYRHSSQWLSSAVVVTTKLMQRRAPDNALAAKPQRPQCAKASAAPRRAIQLTPPRPVQVRRASAIAGAAFIRRRHDQSRRLDDRRRRRRLGVRDRHDGCPSS